MLAQLMLCLAYFLCAGIAALIVYFLLPVIAKRWEKWRKGRRNRSDA